MKVIVSNEGVEEEAKVIELEVAIETKRGQIFRRTVVAPFNRYEHVYPGIIVTSEK